MTRSSDAVPMLLNVRIRGATAKPVEDGITPNAIGRGRSSKPIGSQEPNEPSLESYLLIPKCILPDSACHLDHRKQDQVIRSYTPSDRLPPTSPSWYDHRVPVDCPQ